MESGVLSRTSKITDRSDETTRRDDYNRLCMVSSIVPLLCHRCLLDRRDVFFDLFDRLFIPGGTVTAESLVEPE